MNRLKNYIFYILIINLFILISQNIFSKKEIPHTIIKDNPHKEVTQIETLKKRVNKAELNLSITKIKTRKINLQIDSDRKMIFLNINDLKDDDKLFFVEKIEDIPNSLTSNGRKAFNRLKNTNNNFSYKKYSMKKNRNQKKIEVNYGYLPTTTYIGITNSKYELKKLYKGTYINYNIKKNNIVNIKIWLFGEDLDKITNIILHPSNNNNGNIQIRSNSNYSYPENSIEKINTHTVFDMQGSPLNFDFEDSNTIEIKNISGVSGIFNNQGSFYKERNKYSEFLIPGYKVKSRIWSDYDGFEFSLEKIGNNDGYVKFSLTQKDSTGNIIQNFNIEIFINNKEFKEYFKFYNFSTQKSYSSKYLNRYNKISLDNKIENFISDKLEIRALDKHKVENRFGETGKIVIFDSLYPMKFKSRGFGESTSKKIDAEIYESEMYIKSDWYEKKDETAQFFTSDGIELIYGENKRKIPVQSRFGLFDDWEESTEILSGEIIGLPILNSPLNKNNINGKTTINFNGKTAAFRFVQSGYKVDIYGNDKFLKSIKKLNDSIDFTLDGIEYGLKYAYTDDGYKHYYLTIKKMELYEVDRFFKIKGIDYISKNKRVSKDNRIKILKFEAKNLINEFNSSINKNIFRMEDVSSKLIDNVDKRSIDLGSIYFYQLKTEILKYNTTMNPRIEVANDVYLESNSKATYPKIKVDLSFDKNQNKKFIEMDISGTIGGGNGKNLFLNISKEEYKKFILNGGNINYSLKTTTNTDISSIIVIGNKSPFNKKYYKEFRSKLIDSVTIQTREVKPSISTVEFIRKTPLLKNNYFHLIDNIIQYKNYPNDGYNYNKTLSLIGKTEPYNTSSKKHNVEIIDDSGKTITSIIGSNGNGSYWENIDIGDGNEISISYGKNDKKTYIALTKWNYSKSFGKVVIKHFSGATENISQYYNINFQLPDFDPYIYYDKNYNEKIIEIGATIEKQIKPAENIIIIGEIATNRNNVEITKIESGINSDYEGLRIEGNKEVNIIEEKTGIIFNKKAKIKIVDFSNQEYSSNKLIGAKKHAKVILELPKDLPRNKNYKIISSVSTDTIFNTTSNYILKIGRNKYFKELIEEIKLKGEILVKGESTLKITNEFDKNTSIKFESITVNSLKEIELKTPIPKGIILDNKSGYGILETEEKDQIYLSINGKSEIFAGKIDSLGNMDKKEVLLNKNNILELKFTKNNMSIFLKKIQLGLESKDSIIIKIKRKEKIIMEHKLNIVFPESWFIIKDKIPIDFGEVLEGTDNYFSEGSITIETSDQIDKKNIGIKLLSENIELISKNSNKRRNLFVKIEDYKLHDLNDSNKYILNINSKLNVPINSNLGKQIGIINITVYIKE